MSFCVCVCPPEGKSLFIRLMWRVKPNTCMMLALSLLARCEEQNNISKWQGMSKTVDCSFETHAVLTPLTGSVIMSVVLLCQKSSVLVGLQDSVSLCIICPCPCVTPQDVIKTQDVIIAARCNTIYAICNKYAKCNNFYARCNKTYQREM